MTAEANIPSSSPDVLAGTPVAEVSLPSALDAPREQPGRGFVQALVFSGLCTSAVGAVGLLMVPAVAVAEEVSHAAAQWVLTATLLAGAVSTPILGAASDGSRRRAVLLGTLALVFAGSVLAATAASFPQLVAGRALQGLAYAVIPLATAAARAHLPPERVRGAVALLSVTTVTGSGLSFPLTGLVVDAGGYRVVFVGAAALAAAAVLAVAVTMPRSHARLTGPGPGFDVIGALLLAAALVCGLLAVGQGGSWGWASPLVLGLATTALMLLAVWVCHERRLARPLVDLSSFARRDVAMANIAALGIGAMLFAGTSAVAQFVQAPATAGYGFALAVVGAGLVLLPASIGSQISTRLVRWAMRRRKPVWILPAGPLLVGSGMACLGLLHDHVWQVLVGTFVQGLGLGLTYTVMSLLVVSAVPPEQTGSATALNHLLRIVGGAVGSAVTGAVLASTTLDPSGVPEARGYTLVFVGSAIGCVVLVTLLTGMLILRRPRDGVLTGRRVEQ